LGSTVRDNKGDIDTDEVDKEQNGRKNVQPARGKGNSRRNCNCWG